MRKNYAKIEGDRLEDVFDRDFVGALVLNAGYEPLKVVSWQRAIILWFQEKVDILEYHAQEIRSASRSFRLPSVLLLKQYIKPSFSRSVRLSRQNIFLRDENRCQYCYQVFAKKHLTVDHVLPLSKGGKNTWENLVTACGKCNNRKADRTPQEADMKLYKKPIKPKWPITENVSLTFSSVPSAWRGYLSSLSWASG